MVGLAVSIFPSHLISPSSFLPIRKPSCLLLPPPPHPSAPQSLWSSLQYLSFAAADAHGARRRRHQRRASQHHSTTSAEHTISKAEGERAPRIVSGRARAGGRACVFVVLTDEGGGSERGEQLCKRDQRGREGGCRLVSPYTVAIVGRPRHSPDRSPLSRVSLSAVVQ